MLNGTVQRFCRLSILPLSRVPGTPSSHSSFRARASQSSEGAADIDTKASSASWAGPARPGAPIARYPAAVAPTKRSQTSILSRSGSRFGADQRVNARARRCHAASSEWPAARHRLAPGAIQAMRHGFPLVPCSCRCSFSSARWCRPPRSYAHACHRRVRERNHGSSSSDVLSARRQIR
jgi:hypothetical protein